MKLYLYSVYDTAAVAFIQPFCMQNDGIAVRSFQNTVNDETTTISKHPEQYALYKVAEFNDEDGYIDPLPKAELIVQATEVKSKTPETVSLEIAIQKLDEMIEKTKKWNNDILHDDFIMKTSEILKKTPNNVPNGSK